MYSKYDVTHQIFSTFFLIVRLMLSQNNSPLLPSKYASSYYITDHKHIFFIFSSQKVAIQFFLMLFHPLISHRGKNYIIIYLKKKGTGCGCVHLLAGLFCSKQLRIVIFLVFRAALIIVCESLCLFLFHFVTL